MTSPTGLILSGGGARTAFQVGVLKAISEWVKTDVVPFKVITGTSAGSINAAYLAANADQFHQSVELMAKMWGTLTTRQVYNSEIISINHAKTLFNLFNKIRKGMHESNSILNAFPLAKLLSDRIDFDRIQHCLDEGYLTSLAITATSFQHSMSTTFVQSNQDVDWQRVRRSGKAEKIKVKHLMASTAIPFLFPPVKINNQFYGDGSLRNFAPLSPAIRCGAERLIVIGIRPLEDPVVIENHDYLLVIFSPKSLIQFYSDSLDVDHERLTRINNTIIANSNKSDLKPIHSVIIRPTIDFKELVAEYDYECPTILRQLLRLIGSKNNGNDLKSYLMFEPGYLSALIDQGYKDAQSHKEDVINALNNKKALE